VDEIKKRLLGLFSPQQPTPIERRASGGGTITGDPSQMKITYGSPKMSPIPTSIPQAQVMQTRAQNINTNADQSNIDWLESKVLPITRKANLPDSLVAGQWAIEDRKKDTSMFNLRIKGKVHKYQNVENNVNDYIRTVTNILARKGYDINKIKDPKQILTILQTGNTRFEGHSKDPMDYVKITSDTPEYKYYTN